MKTRNLRRLFAALLLVLLRAAVAAMAAVPCQDADPKHALSGLQPFITAEMEKAKLPGMAMAIVQNKKVLCAEGFGVTAGHPTNSFCHRIHKQILHRPGDGNSQ